MGHATRGATRGAASDEGAIIGPTTRITGRVSGDGDVTVEGVIDGPVAVRGNLRIASSGRVTEAVSAHDVEIAGALEGDVQASGMVRLLAGASVRGDLKGSGIALDEGARFSGRIDCDFDLPKEIAG
jgi:cytoskeletal protein CcmA (bactofilin family)